MSNVLDGQGEPIGALGDGEAVWHTDMSYVAQPPDASMLYALEIPPAGGDTWFCSMKAALAKMPRALADRIARLDIKHDGTYNSGGYLRKGVAPIDDPRTSVGTRHPIVIQHPVSGDRALYLGRRRNAYIMGLEVAESERAARRDLVVRRSRCLRPQMGAGRSGAMGQPHHHASARCVRPQGAPRHAPHPDQGLERAAARGALAGLLTPA